MRDLQSGRETLRREIQHGPASCAGIVCGQIPGLRSCAPQLRLLFNRLAKRLFLLVSCVVVLECIFEAVLAARLNFKTEAEATVVEIQRLISGVVLLATSCFIFLNLHIAVLKELVTFIEVPFCKTRPPP